MEKGHFCTNKEHFTQIQPSQHNLKHIPIHKSFSVLDHHKCLPLGQWFPTWHHPGVLELQLQEILARTTGGEGFWHCSPRTLGSSKVWNHVIDPSPKPHGIRHWRLLLGSYRCSYYVSSPTVYSWQKGLSPPGVP